MSDASARVRVGFSAHWLNGWLLRLLAHPFLRVDGVEHPGSWSREVTAVLPAGRHVVETFVRYRGSSARLGTGRLELRAEAGDDVRVLARNGWANHTPFTPVLLPGPPPAAAGRGRRHRPS